VKVYGIGYDETVYFLYTGKKVFEGKSLFRALYGVYTVTLSDLKLILQNSAAKGPMGKPPQTRNGGNNPEEFKEMKRWKRNTSTDDDSVTASKKPGPVQKPVKSELQQTVAVPTRNFYA
jgi:hypothetical protein